MKRYWKVVAPPSANVLWWRGATKGTILEEGKDIWIWKDTFAFFACYPRITPEGAVTTGDWYIYRLSLVPPCRHQEEIYTVTDHEGEGR